MNLSLAYIISMLKESNDPNILAIVQRLEEEEVEDYLRIEQGYLDARPIHVKFEDGDDLGAFSPRVIHKLQKWNILPRGARR